jgi:site-specific recombinase XerD
MRLTQVDADSIQRLISAALRHGYSIQTATHIRNVVRSIFSHAARIGYHAGINPASLVTLPAMRRKESHTLSLSQVGYLLHAMGYPERELALFTMLVEMSVAEICGLQWRYLNLSATSRKLEHEVIPPLMIAVRKQRYRSEITSAVGSRKRFVRATHPLCSLLRELKARNHFTTLDDFVLVSRGGTPIHPENIAARRLKALGKSFGMAWLSWSVFHRTGTKLRRELGRSFEDEIEKLLSTLRPGSS